MGQPPSMTAVLWSLCSIFFTASSLCFFVKIMLLFGIAAQMPGLGAAVIMVSCFLHLKMSPKN